MTQLSAQYEITRATKRLPFDFNAITETLMESPINAEIEDIIHTPETIVLKMEKKTYIEKRVGQIIMTKYNAVATCKEDMIIFRENDK